MARDQFTDPIAADLQEAVEQRPSATARQKKAFGLLLRRLSENAGLSDAQNTSRDRIYQHTLSGDFERALTVNRDLLQSVSKADLKAGEPGAPKSLEGRLRSLIFGTVHKRNTAPAEPAKSTDEQLATLALDRAVLLGMSGQPGEANALLDRLMDARGEDPGQLKAEEIFEAALGLAELADNTQRLSEVLTARIRFYYELALASGDEALLDTALAALETRQDRDTLQHHDAERQGIRNEAEMLAGFGKAHEKTDLLRKAAKLLDGQAQLDRRSGAMHASYELTLSALACEIELAKLVSDNDALTKIGNRLREIVDLPDTMITPSGRAEARQILGHCLAAQAELDGRIITLRKAFGYLEAAAKGFADLNLHAQELRAMRDLALAKVTAAELLALNPETAEGDMVLAQRYNSEASALQEEISNRLASDATQQ